MNTFIESMIEEGNTLKNQISFLLKHLENCSADALEVISNHGSYQYYYRKADENGNFDQTRKYIRKENKQYAASLAQRDYYYKLLKELEKRSKVIEAAIRTYELTSPEKIAEKCGDGRRLLIQPVLLTNEEYVVQWQNRKYIKKGFADNMPEIYTVRGERVRSKTEKSVADTFERHNIPYHYEFPLELDGAGVIHPDFTVLNVRTRKTYYWEHLGKMDDLQYVLDSLARIDIYERNGIFPGTDLILTYETRAVPLTQRKIDAMINKYLF